MLPFLNGPMLSAGGNDGSFMGILRDLGLTSGLKLCLDAGAIQSYASGEKWLDVSGGGYDFMLGSEIGSPTTGDEPEHVGTPGSLSANEYFEIVNGDEFFRYDSAEESWMNNLSKDNAKFSIAIWHRPKTASGDSGLFCTQKSDGFHGFLYGANGTKNYATCLSGSHLLYTGSSVTADLQWNIDAWHLTAICFDEAIGPGGAFYYRDGSYDPVSSANTWNATLSGSSSDHAEPPNIGLARGGVTSFGPLPAGYRLGGVMIWEGNVLTKSQLDAIWNRQRIRFGLQPVQAWNPSRKNAAFTLSNNDLTHSVSATADIGMFGLDFVETGKYYCEWLISTVGRACYGLAAPLSPMDGTNVHLNANNWVCEVFDGSRINTSDIAGYLGSFSNGDVLGMAIDMTLGAGLNKIWWSKNNTWGTNGGVGDPAAGINAAFTNLSESVAPYICNTSAVAGSGTARFKSSQWTHSPPAGYSAWPTA